MKIAPIILSGGSGTRLWPLSRVNLPKQYLRLFSENTMLQETMLRLRGFDYFTDPIIVCNTDHRFLVAEQCKEININNPTILLEPVSRNSAPAIAAAAIQSLKNLDISTLLVLSTDHLIKDVNSFHKVIKIAHQHAQKSRLVTFGVVPTEANTGFGYIQSSKEIENGAYKVQKFIEKPDLKTAQSYLEKSGYFWNSGMFMFQAQCLIEELKIHAPDIIESVNKAVINASKDLDFINLDEKAFELSPSNSIDYALMEKSVKSMVVPLDAQWSDVGSWKTLYDVDAKNSQANVIKGDVFTENTTNSYINSDKNLLVALGVDNLVIIDTADVTLVANKDKLEGLKNIVNTLQNKKRTEAFDHQKVYRPWGWYKSIEETKYFKVKRLFVKPGEKLSLQLHYKRSEHWVVVNGTAKVTNGRETFNLQKDESTYIPSKTIHSLENETDEVLEIIEVQTGEYFGEDDIIRISDKYNRVSENEVDNPT